MLMISFFGMFSAGAQVKSKAYNVMLKTLLSHTVDEVSVNDINTDEDIIYLDAREKKEFDVSKINNAIWVGYDDFNLSRVDGIEKGKKIIVYCSVGYRSEKISEKLLKNGFTDVSNMYGGIFEWVNEEKEVVNNNNEPTKKVHAFDRTWGIWLKKGKKIYE